MTINIKGYDVLIDEEDYDRVFSHGWCISSSPELDDNPITFSARIKGKLVKLHRFILEAPPGSIVDHKSGDRLDNRKCNLRFCTKRQNNLNSRMSGRNTSGFRGVSYCASRKKYRAYLRLENGHQKHLGYFDSLEAASAAYEKAAEIFYGDYRRAEAV
jgi:hypothetical protein